MDAEAFLYEKGRRTEEALERYIEEWNGIPTTLGEAIRYSLFAGGKRLRPALALGTAEMLCGDDAPALPVACAVEMIHTYSLIHDDLPAMDDDDLRRGKPTSHKVFGEAVAILAGDALMTMAFDFAARANNVSVISEIAQAAGVQGMAGGQLLDLESEGRKISLDELRRIHSLKTGALIRASVRAGAILAGASAADLDSLTAYGDAIGLAFQITDDILDVQGDEEALGKPVGSDAEKHKSTYPAVVGIEQSRDLAEEAAQEALEEIESFGPKAESLRALARYVVERDR